MQVSIESKSLAAALCGLKLGDAKIIGQSDEKKKQKKEATARVKKEDAVRVYLHAVNNHLRIGLGTSDTVCTSYDYDEKCWKTTTALYTLTVELDAAVREEGYCAISFNAAKKLGKFCDTKASDVQIDGYGDAVTAELCGRKCRVTAYPGEPQDFGQLDDSFFAPREAVFAVIGSATRPADVRAVYWQYVSVMPREKGTIVSWTDGAQILWQKCDPDLPSLRRLIPLFALELLKSQKPANEMIEVSRDGIRCGGVLVRFLAQEPVTYPDSAALLLAMSPQDSDAWIRVHTTVEELAGMLKRISSCMNDEVVLFAERNRLHMLTYDDASDIGKGKRSNWESCPAAGTWIDADVDREFGTIGLNAHRLKRALYKQTGPLTLSVQDGDSPVFFDIENSDVRTVLMPLSPAFNRTSILA